MLYCLEEICCERICSSAFQPGIVEQGFFLCVQESVIIGLVRKICSFQRIQIALISRKIRTAGLGLFKRHHDESVSCASPIFSFILVSFSLNIVPVLKKGEKEAESWEQV